MSEVLGRHHRAVFILPHVWCACGRFKVTKHFLLFKPNGEIFTVIFSRPQKIAGYKVIWKPSILGTWFFSSDEGLFVSGSGPWMDLRFRKPLIRGPEVPGGGNSNVFWNFHPELWGRWSHFDEAIFVQMGRLVKNHQRVKHFCWCQVHKLKKIPQASEVFGFGARESATLGSSKNWFNWL